MSRPERRATYPRRAGSWSLRYPAESARALVLKADAVRGAPGVSDALVGKDGDPVTKGLRADEAHRSLVAGLAEEALAGPEHDGEDLQPQFVDEVVLDQRAHKLEAGGDVDFPRLARA